MIKIVIACNSPLTRNGIRDMLSANPDFEIVHIASRSEECLKSIKKMSPDILLVCSHLVAKTKLEIVSKIKSSYSHQKIVVFNSYFSFEQEMELVRLGVEGIFDSKSSLIVIMKGLREIATGSLWLRRELLNHSLLARREDGGGKLFEKIRPASLTEKEFQVLTLIGTGYKNREIADKLFISEGTVKSHINTIFKKINVSDRLQATLFAIKHKMFEK